ncbi:uncharacterized protein RHOBADRAFT_54456 [Rhodotorula graminis WP1]|uniref:Uncharacterized protein n=1 Tax=Rhodotorula graminis (strain WP1) TaxID=578459 RepID=A0A0P9F293_RHOGW|nr:uncharacterized protein RHOBADRAFT_54456 [Rhodotorula graminis WP1]KPV73862.1 hypothetical protein RHOBADRAFT_54456 [Rhodotorula graminis WP1]
MALPQAPPALLPQLERGLPPPPPAPPSPTRLAPAAYLQALLWPLDTQSFRPRSASPQDACGPLAWSSTERSQAVRSAATSTYLVHTAAFALSALGHVVKSRSPRFAFDKIPASHSCFSRPLNRLGGRAHYTRQDIQMEQQGEKLYELLRRARSSSTSGIVFGL